MLDRILRAYIEENESPQRIAVEQDLPLDLVRDMSPEGRARLHYFLMNKGPWSRLDHNKPFVPGVPAEKPPQAGFYPDDMTKDEFTAWAKGLSDADRKQAEGFFTVIRRDNGKLKLVPYSQEYQQFLAPAAKLLQEAAALTTNATLKNFLSKRAEAFLSDNYYASDVAWMDLDAPIDVTIGPYETYEDGLFSYKAAFEAYVNLRDEAETAKLRKFSQYLQELEDHLPIDARYRNPKLGAASPIRVVNEVFASGEGNPDIAVRFSRERTADYSTIGFYSGLSGYPARIGPWRELGDNRQ